MEHFPSSASPGSGTRGCLSGLGSQPVALPALPLPLPLGQGAGGDGARAAPRKICTLKPSGGGCPGEHSLISGTEPPKTEFALLRL